MEISNRMPAIIGLATLCGLLAAFFAWAHLHERASAASPPPKPTSKLSVVVTNREIPAGTVMRAEMVSLQEVDARTAPVGALSSSEEVVGRVATHSLPAGSVLAEGSVIASASRLGPAYSLSTSMRAITIAVDEVSGIAGFLKPGDRVDVFATFDKDRNAVTRLVLQNLQVLAIDRETQAPSLVSTEKESTATNAASPSTGDRHVAVTLAVTVPEAERLVLADSRGKVRLALRPATGGSFVTTQGTTEATLSGLAETRVTINSLPGKPPAAPVLPTAPRPPAKRLSGLPPSATKPVAGAGGVPTPRDYQVTVVRGSTVETVTVPNE